MCRFEVNAFIVGRGWITVGCKDSMGICILSSINTVGGEMTVSKMLDIPMDHVVQVSVVDKSKCQVGEKYNG